MGVCCFQTNVVDSWYWEALPLYARYWMKHDYEQIQTLDDYKKFIKRYLNEYRSSKNEVKRLAIAMVIFPMYEQLTGNKYGMRT